MNLKRCSWIPFEPHKSYTRRYNEHFYRLVSESISGRILDLGAKQSNESKFKTISKGVEEYYSIDLSEHESINILADGRNLPIRSNTFDTVILSAVLEHVPIQDVSRLLKEVKRILVPGGSVIAYVAFVYPLHSTPRDYYRPTYFGLNSLFSDVGLTTRVFVGGGLGETLLHTIYIPMMKISSNIGVKWLRWGFIVPHLLCQFISIMLSSSGIDSKSDNWYLGQLVVGEA